MERKKWTPKAEVTKELLKFREKRKWQLALRRYVLEKNTSAGYAYYFGLSIEQFRNWLEIQFTEGLNWENFGEKWQLDHIVPVAYFDFTIEEDLMLCWNFSNIRVKAINDNKNGPNGIDVMAAKPYFEALYSKTGFSLCLKMIDKISRIEADSVVSEPAIEDFIIKNKEHLQLLDSFSKEEFNRLNTGSTIDDLLLERVILKKFG